MNPAKALANVMADRPRGVIVIAEQADGRLALTIGAEPAMTLEHINFLLDQVKRSLLEQVVVRPNGSNLADMAATIQQLHVQNHQLKRELEVMRFDPR